MSASDEVKGVVRFFYILGFPSGVIALAGCLSFGLGVWREEVTLNNKRIILGAALFSMAIFLHRLPRILGTYRDHNEHRRVAFSFKDLMGAVVYGALAFVTWRWLWHLLHA